MSQINLKSHPKTIKDFNELILAPEQSAMLENIAKTIEEHLEIDHIILMGFIWQSLIDLQKSRGITIKDIVGMDPCDKGRLALEAFSYLKIYLSKIYTSCEEKSKLDTAIAFGVEYYSFNFMNRVI